MGYGVAVETMSEIKKGKIKINKFLYLKKQNLNKLPPRSILQINLISHSTEVINILFLNCIKDFINDPVYKVHLHMKFQFILKSQSCNYTPQICMSVCQKQQPD